MTTEPRAPRCDTCGAAEPIVWTFVVGNKDVWTEKPNFDVCQNCRDLIQMGNFAAFLEYCWGEHERTIRLEKPESLPQDFYEDKQVLKMILGLFMVDIVEHRPVSA